MKKIRYLGITVVLLFIGLSANAQSTDTSKNNDGHRSHSWSHGHRSMTGHGGGKRDHAAAIPNLTADQQKKIDALKTPFQKDKLALRNQIAEKNAHLRTLQTAEKADLTAINKTIDELTALESQQMKKTAAHREDVRKLLTEEQRIAFDSHRAGGARGHGSHRF